jgi:hypothetical protein
MANALWLAAYLAMIVAVVWLILSVRSWTLAAMSTAREQANWDAFRSEEIRNETAGGPVSRRVPKSPQPPALVLMRDHFPVVMSAGLVFASLLFGALMIAIRGAWASPAEGSSPAETPPRQPSAGP